MKKLVLGLISFSLIPMLSAAQTLSVADNANIIKITIQKVENDNGNVGMFNPRSWIYCGNAFKSGDDANVLTIDQGIRAAVTTGPAHYSFKNHENCKSASEAILKFVNADHPVVFSLDTLTKEVVHIEIQ